MTIKTKHKNGLSYDLNGFKFISIKGAPRERGVAYGYFSGEDFKKIQEMMKYNCYENYGKTWDFFIESTKEVLKEKIKNEFPEFYEEMEGIADGINESGYTHTSIDEILAWNNIFTIMDSWYNKSNPDSKEGGGQQDRCSLFIACGDYTKDGKIVCAHNSFENFIDGQFWNYVVDIHPDKGNNILMQSAPGWIWSGSDFWITDKGIIGTEATIGGFKEYENNLPISCRIRQAMQYGNNLDDYVEILLKGNSGDYANSWYIGDINTNEIMMLELGLKYHNVQKTKNGYFVGFNGSYDPQIRNLECNNQGFYDIRRHQGARRVRLTDLMEENKGKITIELAKKLIADHYDVYLKKENPCSRTVCSHYELDAREYMSQVDRPVPFQPRGALDGFVVDSNMAKNMTICGKWGSSCDIPFDAEKFFNEHHQWLGQKPYLMNRPIQPWTEFKIMDIKMDGKKEKKGKEEKQEKHEKEGTEEKQGKMKKNERKTRTKQDNAKKSKNKTIRNNNKTLILEQDEEDKDE
jgi:hypothetical protein